MPRSYYVPRGGHEINLTSVLFGVSYLVILFSLAYYFEVVRKRRKQNKK